MQIYETFLIKFVAVPFIILMISRIYEKMDCLYIVCRYPKIGVWREKLEQRFLLFSLVASMVIFALLQINMITPHSEGCGFIMRLVQELPLLFTMDCLLCAVYELIHNCIGDIISVCLTYLLFHIFILLNYKVILVILLITIIMNIISYRNKSF